MTFRWMLPVLRSPEDTSSAPEAAIDMGHGSPDDFDGEAAVLADLMGETPEEPKETAQGEPEAPAEEGEGEAPEGEEEAPSEDPEDPEFDIEVNKEARKVKLSDLKALYGRQDELARSVSEASQARTEALARSSAAVESLDKLIARANDKLKPYSELDWLGVSAKLMAEGRQSEWEALRADALALKADVDYLTGERDKVVGAAQQVAQVVNREAASAAVATLAGPVERGGIPGWNDKLYSDILGYAVRQGVPKATAEAMVDPVAIRILHKAMLYEAGSRTATEKVAAAKSDSSKVSRPGASGGPTAGRDKSAMARLARTGSVDDATAAILEDLLG